MTFVSVEFILFATFIIPLYFVLAVKWRWLLLLLASYAFYCFHNPAYIILLLLSTALDFYAGQKIASAAKKPKKKLWLYLSLSGNLGLLFFFKYFNFFTIEVNDTLQYLGIAYELPEHNFLLPLGISFYTFQTISYSVDIYRGFLKPEKHFGRFALYVCFFPQLVAGPIEKASKLLPQFHFNYQFEYKRVVEGLRLILWGFFKKVVVADCLGIYVNEVFDISNGHHGPVIAIGAFLFWLQLFYDFSAYCDIAIGAARILGVKLSRNFYNYIYTTSFTEFWKEWHITLTNWFRNYVFFALLKISKSKWFWYFSLFLTFVLTGLWHGAAWTFVLWGALNGIFLVIEHYTKKQRMDFYEWIGLTKFPKLFYLFGVFTYLIIGLIPAMLFRSGSIDDFYKLILRLFDWSNIYVDVGLGLYEVVYILCLIVTVDGFNIKMGKAHFYDYLAKFSLPFRWLIYLILILGILFLNVPTNDFVYFEF